MRSRYRKLLSSARTLKRTNKLHKINIFEKSVNPRELTTTNRKIFASACSLVSLTPDIYVCMYLSINYVRPII